MLDNEYYTQEVHGPYELFDLGDFQVEEGQTIRECKLAYATFGKLNAAKDNAILFPSWFSSTTKILEDVYVGKGKALDPDEYFIILANQIGNGLSSAPHNTPPPFHMARFPRIRISDDIRAQHKLVTEKFGIEQLALVLGGSMGAEQTYEWAVRYPDMVKRAAPIAGTARCTPHDFIYVDTLREALRSDPAWNNGWYTDPHACQTGLRRHAQVWSVMGFSTEFYKRELWRDAGFSSLDDFLVGYLEGYFLPMDPNNLLCMGWKWQRGDVSRMTGGDLAKALARIKAKVFLMPIDEDMFFPPRDHEQEQKMIPNSEMRVIHSLWGHLGLFGGDPEYNRQVDEILKELLSIPV